MTTNTSKHLIIGLAGKHEAGKTTFMHMLMRLFEEKFPLKAVTVSSGQFFSRALGDLTLGDSVYIHNQRKKNPLMRLMLETLATKILKDNPRFLLDWIEDELKSFSAPHIFLLDGVRRLNEQSFIHARGGHLFKIIRPGYMSATLLTETELDDLVGDSTIINDRPIEDLWAIAKHHVGELAPRFDAILKSVAPKAI